MYNDEIFLSELKSGIRDLARTLGTSEQELVEQGISMLESKRKKKKRRITKHIIQ